MRVPAPLDPASLAPVLVPSVAGARTLPAAAYVSPEVFAWERDVLLGGSWLCAGRLAAGHGAQAVSVAGRDLVVTRDASGEVCAFHNVCRHRGHPLLGSGERREGGALTCPYHAWTYGLDGALRRAPRFPDVPGFSTEAHGLVSVRVAAWREWLFVDLSGEAPPLATWLGSLDRLVAPWQPERCFIGAEHAYTVRANWKTITENFHECYHCPSIHPELCAVTDLASGGNVPLADGYWIGGPMRLKAGVTTMSLDGQSRGVPMPGLEGDALRQVSYYGVFPNLLVSLHPDYVMTHHVEPLGPEETRVTCTWLFPPEAKARPDFDPAYAADFWDRTNRQDWRACEAVARGLRSPGFRQGPLTWKEDGVHAFMAMMANAYRDGVVSRPGAILERPRQG